MYTTAELQNPFLASHKLSAPFHGDCAYTDDVGTEI